MRIRSQRECLTVDVEVQALQVCELRGGQTQKTRGGVVDATSGTCVSGECVCKVVSDPCPNQTTREIKVPVEIRTRVVPVSTIPAVLVRMEVPAVP